MATVTINGFRCHYDYLERSPDSPTVAFANGIMSPIEAWANQLQVAERLGFNVLRHEYRGQWRSQAPAGPYSMSQHAADLAALLDLLGVQRCHLVGTSYGGFVSLRFAADFPERVQTLTVIATSARLRRISEGIVRNWHALARGGDVEALLRGMLPDLYSEGVLRQQPDMVESRLAALQSALAEAPEFFAGQDALYQTNLQDLGGDGLVPVLGAIRCPSLVVAAELDRLYPPEHSTEIAAHVPGAGYVVIPGAGHAVVAERPREINTLIAGQLLQAG